jgi:uracil-DNA glycosylase
MDPREQLRRYLEQRRDMGERELILDGMSVDDVMRILGAGAGRVAAPAATLPNEREAPAAVPPRDRSHSERESRTAPETTSDWREVLRATGSAPASRAPTPVPPRDEPPPPDEPPEDAIVARVEAPPPPRARPTAPASPAPAVPAGELAPGIVVGTPSRELFGGALSTVTTLDELAEIVAKCTKCPLYKTATKPVPGQGSPTAELVCVGEAPGENEDKTGLAFVGAAGQLLTKILAAINLSREDVFICNVLKHRPPGNRNPSPQEVEACSPYLVRQLEIIRPKVIVAFGTFAAQTLLNTTLSIGKLRGSVHRYYGIPLVVTYHPAALLRNPAWKRPTWEDVQLARRVLDRAAGA